eukprot:scaffold8639_cov93-Skeletonema_dohrnii-CCMP3373.AAC.4
MTNYHGSPEPVERHIQSVRYIWPSTKELVGVSDASSGHLRHCNDADTILKSLSRAKDASILRYHAQLSWVTRTC